MKKNHLTQLSLLFFLMINTSINAKTLIKKGYLEGIENEIIVTLIKKKRKTTLKTQNKTIKANEGSKLNFKSSNLSYAHKYIWDFGDGTKKEGQSITHQYNNAGTYNIGLQVIDPLGNYKLSKLQLIVREINPTRASNLAPIIGINNSEHPESFFSLEELVENVLIDGDCGSIGDFETLSFGIPQDNSRKSYGYFNRGESNTNFPFKDGIVLTTGNAFAAGNTIQFPGPLEEFPDFTNDTPGDADLEAALGIVETYDATFVKFNFTPQVDNISFRFIMASEEYLPDYECEFSDGFAFLLRETGTTNYTNLAVLPNGTPISVTNINNSPDCGINQNFFEGYEIDDTNYYGRTKALTASSDVTPGVTYEIKLVVADHLDDFIDAAVFIEGGSFNLGLDLGDNITIANGNATCNDQAVILETEFTDLIHTWYLNDEVITGETTNTLSTVQPGVYKVELDNNTSCLLTDSIIVEFLPEDDASFSIEATCSGSTFVNITGSPNGVFSFNPSPTDGALIDSATGVISNGVSGSSYSVDYTTSGSCPNTSSQTIILLEQEDASFILNPECEGATAEITGTSGGIFSFNPTPLDGASINPNSGEITNGIPETTYNVEYTTQGNCPDSLALEVTLLESSCLFFSIPDGFSPNNDGVNDVLEIKNARNLFPDYELEVFNRYGNLVYSGNANSPKFDGKSNQSRKLSDKLLPIGMYFYVFKFNDKERAPQQGTVYISR